MKQAFTFDLLLRRGLVVDGSGTESLIADVGVEGERIAAVGDLREATARCEIDGSGKVVCPGFIDIHTHSEITLLADPGADSKIRQGVTTEAVGNCGFSAAPVTQDTLEELRALETFLAPDVVKWDWRNTAEYLQMVRTRKPALNVVTLVGHVPLRAAVLGFADVDPDAHQLAQMVKLTEEALDQGACGISAGLIYPPSSYAKTEELVALVKVAAQRDALFAVHIRDEGDHLLASVQEAIEIAESSGCRLEISHLKVAGKRNWGTVGKAIALIEEAADRGLGIGFDAYPYTSGVSTMTTLIPDEYHDGGPSKLLERLADPKTYRQILAGTVRKTLEKIGVENEQQAFEHIMVGAVFTDDNAAWQGKTLAAVAAARGTSPGEEALRLVVEEEGKVDMLLFFAAEEDNETVLSHSLCAIGSDSWSLSPSGPTRLGYCHPRYYGTFPRFLSHCVRERKLMSLEEAIRRITLLPAQRLRLKDRGLLKPGFFADIVVMDYENLTDLATYENPQQFPQGIEYVIVNGALAVDNGTQTKARSGKVF